MINLIPMPSSHKMFDGYCFLGEKLTLKSDFDLPLVKLERSEKADITVTKDASLPEEASLMSGYYYYWIIATTMILVLWSYWSRYTLHLATN